MRTKFALHNFSGKPVAFYLVEGENIVAAPKTVRAPSHHILIIDVSGSMYCDMDAIRSSVEKLLTLEEFNDDSLKISLISYASSGDCKVHFSKTTVGQVMAPNSKFLTEIRNLRTRGMTGISQALLAAEKLIDDSETTCISLHSDGYANDPSPYAEATNLVNAANLIAKHPTAFCNTVAYRSNCDFPLLTAIANKLSGTCVQASGIKQMYQALHDTTALLMGNVASVIEAGIADFDFITFVSRKGRKVLGGTDSLQVKGLAADDDKTVYRYRKVSEADFNASPAPLDESTPVLAFARTQVALGNLNTAKFALCTTRNKALLGHFRALVGNEIAAMAADVETVLFDNTTWAGVKEYGIGTKGPSVLDVLGVLAQYQGSLRVNLDTLAVGYKRRGLKRVAGSRDDQGVITKPAYKLQTPRDKTSVAVSGIEFNRNTATCNIRLAQKATLIETATGNVIEQVAGIPLDLRDFNNYTVVGDGAVNIPVLPIRTSDKRCFAALKALGVVSGEFNPESEISIDLSKLAVVDFDGDFSVPAGTFAKLTKLTVLQKILSGALKEAAPPALTPEQVEALKAHCLSPALYFNAPTCNPYADLTTALANGEVDTRISYKVEIGDLQITNLGKLKSGNAYLQRRFDATLDGKPVEKPTLDLFGNPGVVWSIKKLSARTKLDAVDDASYPIYEEFLGLGSNGSLAGVLALVGGGPLTDLLKVAGDTLVENLTVLRRSVEDAIDEIYRKDISPLVFYVGSTGIIPDGLGAGSALTADGLTAKHPNVSLAKAEKEEGRFYLLPGGHLLTVYAEGEYFSTEAGVKVASAL